MKNYDDFDLDFKQMNDESKGDNAQPADLSGQVLSLASRYTIKTYLKCTDGSECATPTKDRPAASCHKNAVAGTVQPRC